MKCLSVGEGRVAVVEPDPFFRSLLARAISTEFAIGVDACATAETALAVSPAPLAVVTELHLPGISGRDLAWEYQARSQTTLVVLMSKDAAGLQQASRQADALFLKPFSPVVLMAFLGAVGALKGATELARAGADEGVLR